MKAASEHSYNAVVIGASAGAIEALSILLPALPSSYPLPIMIVVHLPPDRTSVLADLMQAKCALPVHEAADKEAIQPGHVYIAPPDYHLLVEPNGFLSLSSEEPVLYSRPSIDVLFETAADHYGTGLIGVVLSGANADGAQGLLAVSRAGGTALVQTPETAYADAMPRAAMTLNPNSIVMDLKSLAASLASLEFSLTK